MKKMKEMWGMVEGVKERNREEDIKQKMMMWGLVREIYGLKMKGMVEGEEKKVEKGIDVPHLKKNRNWWECNWRPRWLKGRNVWIVGKTKLEAWSWTVEEVARLTKQFKQSYNDMDDWDRYK